MGSVLNVNILNIATLNLEIDRRFYMSAITDKNKFVSIYVNKENYEKFAKITAIQGLSNNKAINILIAEYVAKNNYLLSPDNSRNFQII